MQLLSGGGSSYIHFDCERHFYFVEIDKNPKRCLQKVFALVYYVYVYLYTSKQAYDHTR